MTIPTNLHTKLAAIFGNFVTLTAVFTKTEATFSDKTSSYKTEVTKSNQQEPGTYNVVVNDDGLQYTLTETPKATMTATEAAPAKKQSPEWGFGGKVPR